MVAEAAFAAKPAAAPPATRRATRRRARWRERGFGERCQFIKLALRLRRREMVLENAQHRVRMSAARRKPPLFRGAELLQMHIADAMLIEPGGKLTLRKPRPPRCRDGTYIDQEPDLRPRERVEKRGAGRLLE